MQGFKYILNFYINSSIHVALAVVSLSYITLLELGYSYDKDLMGFVFFATITGYNFVKFFGVAKFHHRSLTTWLKLIQVFSLICFVFMCYYALKLESKTIFYVAGFGIITFLYAIPFLPQSKFLDEQNNLRSIGGLKVFLIALVWTWVTVFLPILNNGHSINADVFIIGVQRFLLVIMLMIPFEIRDLQFDSIKLATIPQILGVKGTKIAGVLMGFLMLILEFLKQHMVLVQLLILSVICVITLLLILFSRERQSRYYCAFWVEGIPVLWLFLLFCFT